MRYPPHILAVFMCFTLLACEQVSTSDAPAIIKTAEAQKGEWVLHGYNGGEQRYVPSAQINDGNVHRLGLAFSYDGILNRGRVLRGAQATPLMKDGVLYFTGPWSVAYAVDARTGEELWVHDPEVEGWRPRVACCDAVNRGMALRGDTLFLATFDGFLEALDRHTGKLLWRVDTLLKRKSSYTITAAPRLAGDLVVIGNGGAEMGVRGYVTAYDQRTGKQVWRFWTVPSANEPENDDVAFARKSWSDKTRWDYGGGGTVWDSMVYDADLDLLYIGVGNGSPWPVWDRNGGERPDNLYLSSIVAVQAKTGKRVWHYQTTPADSWDYTATQHMILADIEWQGQPRKVIMQAPKNGFFYVLDRVTGALLSAEPFVPVTWASHVDMKTGRPVVQASSDFSEKKALVMPSVTGGHNWHPMAYNPKADLVYIPTLEIPIVLSEDKNQEAYLPLAKNNRTLPEGFNPDQHLALLEGKPEPVLQSLLKAWNPQTASVVWQSDPMPYWGGGVLTTAGNLTVQGSPDGFLNFYHAQTGKLLKRIETGIGISAPPISYELDGVQYIAVIGGMGGGMARSYMPGFATEKYQNLTTLFVFKLDGAPLEMPPEIEPKIIQPIPTGLPADAPTIARGKKKYELVCINCHIPGGYPGAYPDLWNLSPEVDAMFDEIVLGGIYEYAGMGSFADVLDKEDTLAIRAYLADERRKLAQTNGQKEDYFAPTH